MSDQQTLPVLLAHALGAWSREYQEQDVGLVPLVVAANLLRVIPHPSEAPGVDDKELPALVCLSKRAVRVAVGFREIEGLVQVVPDKDVKGWQLIALTDAGLIARDASQAAVVAVDIAWRARYAHAADLAETLGRLLGKVDVELPHYPTGYGQGDSSLTGGEYIPLDEGPPRIPPHGEEWPVVLRTGVAPNLPLYSLLSQVLAAFVIDYDLGGEGVFGGLGGTLRFFRHVGEEGVLLGAVKASGDITGTGRSNYERHKLVVVEPGRPAAARRVLLTKRGQRVRDRYPAHAFEIEEGWVGRFGGQLMHDLRAQLEALEVLLAIDLPDFPDTNSWLRQRPRAG